MNLMADAKAIAAMAGEQRGVFAKADLQTVLGERHRAAFGRRVRALVDHGILRRFCRGFYVTGAFDLPTLSQRIASASYISFGTVLARDLLIGTSPDRQVIAAKTGRGCTYRALGVEIVHVGIAPHLDFGHEIIAGVRFATAEKALLDVLYYHLRGRHYPFDIHSDIRFDKLDRRRLREYLPRYRNPKFVTFAKKLLEWR